MKEHTLYREHDILIFGTREIGYGLAVDDEIFRVSDAQVIYRAQSAEIALDVAHQLIDQEIADHNMTVGERIRASQAEVREAGNCKHEFEHLSGRCWICGLTRAQCENN